MKDVLEPLIFGAKLSAGLIQNNLIEEEQRNKFTCQDGDYRKLCMNLERLLAKVKYQRDLWKDRFFFNALSLPITSCVPIVKGKCVTRFTIQQKYRR